MEGAEKLVPMKRYAIMAIVSVRQAKRCAKRNASTYPIIPAIVDGVEKPVMKEKYASKAVAFAQSIKNAMESAVISITIRAIVAHVDKPALTATFVVMENVQIFPAMQATVEDADWPVLMQTKFAVMEIAHLKLMYAVTEPSVLLARSVAMAIASVPLVNGNVLGNAFLLEAPAKSYRKA